MSGPGSDVAYGTRRAGNNTTLEVIDADNERRLRRVLLPGRLSVPAVAYDATPSGITPDDTKLVLIEPRRACPRAEPGWGLCGPRRLRVRRTVRLRGDFSFDAISPDGRTMYVIRYPSRDPQRYEVRAYDLRTGRLLPDPIVDPREPDERMSGRPVTRATAAGNTRSTTAASTRSCTRSTRSAPAPSASTSTCGAAGSGARGSSSSEVEERSHS